MRMNSDQHGPCCSCRGTFYDASDVYLFTLTTIIILTTTMEVRECVPIKCMEAVVLAIYLTNGIPGLGRSRLIRIDVDDYHSMITWQLWWRFFRFPINFKSEVEETSLLSGRKFFYHVVLGIAYKGAQDDDYDSIYPMLASLETLIRDRHVTFNGRCVKFFSKWFPGKLGAVGLSRQSSLMDKPVILIIITLENGDHNNHR